MPLRVICYKFIHLTTQNFVFKVYFFSGEKKYYERLPFVQQIKFHVLTFFWWKSPIVQNNENFITNKGYKIQETFYLTLVYLCGWENRWVNKWERKEISNILVNVIFFITLRVRFRKPVVQHVARGPQFANNWCIRWVRNTGL